MAVENTINATSIRVEDAHKAVSMFEIYNQIVNDKKVLNRLLLDPSATVGDQGYIGAFCIYWQEGNYR